LGKELADRFDLRKPSDIELLSAFLGADKDRIWRMGKSCCFADAIDAVEQRENVPWTFAAGDGG